MFLPCNVGLERPEEVTKTAPHFLCIHHSGGGMEKLKAMKFSKCIILAMISMVGISCTHESQDITDQISNKGGFAGSYALDDGTGLTNAYLTFSNDKMYLYSQNEKVVLAENYLWFTKASDYTLDISGDYSVSSGILYCNGVPYGKIQLTESELTLEGKRYRKILGLKEDRYTSIQIEGELTRLCTYQKGNLSIPVSVTKTIPSGKIAVQNNSSWISRCELKDRKLELVVDENNNGVLRMASVVLSYPGAENVTLSVKQEYSTSVIICSPSYQDVGNEGGNYSFSYSIQNPRDAASVTVSTSTDWITNIVTSGNVVSYKVSDNASINRRNGNITLNYGLPYSNSYASKSFTVRQSSFPITVFTLNKSELALQVGKSETLQLSLYPEDVSVLWSSSKTSVATVSSTGKVTAVLCGEAMITVISSDGSKSATCAVTVTPEVTGVSLNKTSLSLSEGESEKLTATVSPSTAIYKSVSWATNNESVAKVDQTGKVTAVSKGTATITATAKDGSGKSASCSVSVKRLVASITLDKSSIVLYKGNNETITATVSPSTASNKNITWSSSNTSVATVSSSGVVSGVAKGTATISATAQDGSGVSKTCQVEVKQYVTGITLGDLILSNGQNMTLTAIVTPSDASDKSLTWSSSNTSVATVSESGVVTAVSEGTTTITAVAKDGSGKSASCLVRVVGNDLSSSNSANCYIVSAAGSYAFETVKGNSSELVGNVASAEVLWESFGTSTVPVKGDIIGSVYYANNHIAFVTPSTLKSGNAVIAAKDASGNILWSWHIWVCGGYDPLESAQRYYNNAGRMMDRNLGATSSKTGDVRALGLFYQWGRKDPFLGSSSISDTKAASTLSWPSSVSSNSSNGTIAYAIAHPTTFITHNSYNDDWYYTGDTYTDNTRWKSRKTIYDPCPPGWKVPESEVWSLAGRTSSDFSYTFDSTYKGMNFSGKFGDSEAIWYPAAGSYGSGSGKVGYWWSYTPSDRYALGFKISYYGSGGVNPSAQCMRDGGLSIRCVSETIN